MNLTTNRNFHNIRGAISAYQNAVTSTLKQYKIEIERAKADATKFKDETTVFAEKKSSLDSVARNEIENAKQRFVATVESEIDSLKKELAGHLTMAPSPVFMAIVRAYFDYGITPSRVETEALIAQNSGVTLGYEVLNAMLKKTGASFRVDAPDGMVYERDIAALERLTTSLMWSDTEYFHELLSLFDGVQRQGEIHGYKWDRVQLMIARNSFESNIKAIDAIEKRWNISVSPSLRALEEYEDDDAGTPVEKLASDIKAVANAATIEHSDGENLEQARRMGEERAAADAKAATVLSLYR